MSQNLFSKEQSTIEEEEEEGEINLFIANIHWAKKQKKTKKKYIYYIPLKTQAPMMIPILQFSYFEAFNFQ